MKAALISIDALDWEDLPVFRKARNMGRILAHADAIRSEAITPAQTYPCHASILSGSYPSRTFVIDNLSHPERRWQYCRSSIKCPILTDAARSSGLTTAAVCFPMTACADIDYLVPEIWTEREGDDSDPLFSSACSEKGYGYYLRHKAKLDWMRTPGMDLFASSVFVDIVKEQKPDIALLHLSYLDHQKHLHGSLASDVPHAVDFIDNLLGSVFEALSSDYIIFITGDHAHRAQKGSVDISIEGISVHPTGQSAEIYLDGISERDAISKLAAVDGIAKVYGQKELASLGLPPSFDIFAEAEEGYVFTPNGKVTASGHGYVGSEGPYPPFIAINAPCRFRTDRCSIVDEAPTILSLFGLKLDGADGKCLF